MNTSQKGFTLIEIAVVMLILSLVLSAGINMISAQRINTGLAATENAQNTAVELLRAFFLRNGRLPCPADPTLPPGNVNYGVEECDLLTRGVAATNVYWGVLPFATLGNQVARLTDGWDNQFYYVVIEPATETVGVTTTSWEEVSWTQVDMIRLFVNQDPALPLSVPTISDGIMALVSAGANRSGGYTHSGTQLPAPLATAVKEPENQDPDLDVNQWGYSEDDEDPFDDIVLVFNEDTFTAPLVEAGSIKTKMAMAMERMQLIKQEALRIAAADNLPISTPNTTPFEVPPFITALTPVLTRNAMPTVDPWGNAFVWNGGGTTIDVRATPPAGIPVPIVNADTFTILTNSGYPYPPP